MLGVLTALITDFTHIVETMLYFETNLHNFHHTQHLYSFHYFHSSNYSHQLQIFHQPRQSHLLHLFYKFHLVHP